MTALVTQPWVHQRAGADFALARKGALLAMGVGTGKSLAALAVMDESDARMVLVLSPLSVMGVWPREVARHAPGWGHVAVLDRGSSLQRADQLRHTLALAKARNERIMVVVNYDSCWRADLGQVIGQRLWDLIILDESHRIKAVGGKASRFCGRLRRQAKRVLGLTGTPTPHSPLDLFGQARAIEPGAFGPSFVAFRNRYAVITLKPGFPKIIGWQNAEELQQRFRSFAVEVRSEDVLDLPPVTTQVVPVDLAPRTMRVYRQMEREFYAEVERGEVTAANALVKLLRLAQITGGVVPLDDGTSERIGTEKRDALADLAEDLPRPLVAFCRFHNDLDAVAYVAADAGQTYHELSGRLKELTPHAEMRPDTDMLGVQIQSGGLGVDLTLASVGVFVSLGYSLGDYTQACGRLHRPGQIKHTHFLHLVAKGTVDEAIMAALEQKKDVIETIVHGRPREARQAA